MNEQSAALPWRRELPEGVTVTVERAAEAAGDPVPAGRPVAWVALRMPDYVADTVSHLVASGAENLRRLTGPDERALAEALYVASQVNGYHCPEGGLVLPEGGDL